MSNSMIVKSVFNWDDNQPKRMDPEFKKLWVAALRSGKYEQAVSKLKAWRDSINDWGYCCLGVAADLKCDNLPEGDTKIAWHPATRTILMVWDEAKEMYVEEESLLPAVLNLELGLTSIDAVVALWTSDDYYDGDEFPLYENTYISLTDLNDAGMPFSQIADIIEYFL